MWKKIAMLLVVATQLLSLPGCQSISPFALVPIGVNVVIFWKNGEARKYYTGSFDEVSLALKESVSEFKHSIVERESSTERIEMTSLSDNHKFHWTISVEDEKVVLIKCRVDFWGDKEYVELILRSVDKKLGVETKRVIDQSTERRWLRRKH